MTLEEVVEAVRRAAIDPVGAARLDVDAALAAIGALRTWCDGREVALATRAAEVTGFPEHAIAEATRGTIREAERVLERGATVAAVPGLAEALQAGDVCGAHIDAFTRTLVRLEPEHRADLLAIAVPIVESARHATPDVLARRLATEARRIERDRGVARFERQRRDTALTCAVDAVSGMWRITGRIDPFHGLQLSNRIAATVDALFAERTPAFSPTDPALKQAHLRALALLELAGIDTSHLDRGASANGTEMTPCTDLLDTSVAGWYGGARVAGAPARPVPGRCECGRRTNSPNRPPRADITVVVDSRSFERADDGPNADPILDWGLPVELPAHVLASLGGGARAGTVIVRDGRLEHAPGVLELGRSTRLAGADQRRVLRALHPTCSVPGCSVRFERCKIHHITWWRDGGATDLANLLPLCPHHHRLVHEQRWEITLAPDRSIVIRHPDGSVMSAGPPTRAGP